MKTTRKALLDLAFKTTSKTIKLQRELGAVKAFSNKEYVYNQCVSSRALNMYKRLYGIDLSYTYFNK